MVTSYPQVALPNSSPRLSTYLMEAFQEALRVLRSGLPAFTDEETFVLLPASLIASPHPQVKFLANLEHNVFLGVSLLVLVPTH